jgi:hypothetical protein
MDNNHLVHKPVSSTNKINRHDITEILLKVALNTITANPNPRSINSNKIHLSLEIEFIRV